MKQKIIEYANSIGVKHIGFTCDDDGNSVIVMLFPYYVAGESGNIAMYARGRDYHAVARDKMNKICKFLKQNGMVSCQIQVDIGELNDRDLAYYAGLGFYGKNGLIINDELGSYFAISEIITDLVIAADTPANGSCKGCNRCVASCPGQALTPNGLIKEKCASYLSQTKGDLTEEQTKTVKDSGLVWGCDICQAVCPHNEGLETTAMPEFLEERITSLMLGDIENLSNREFLKKYKNNAFAWRGKGVIERNLKLINNT